MKAFPTNRPMDINIPKIIRILFQKNCGFCLKYQACPEAKDLLS